MGIKLKPCECGSENVYAFTSGDVYWVQCYDCLKSTKPRKIEAPSALDAIEYVTRVWNEGVDE